MSERESSSEDVPAHLSLQDFEIPDIIDMDGVDVNNNDLNTTITNDHMDISDADESSTSPIILQGTDLTDEEDADATLDGTKLNDELPTAMNNMNDKSELKCPEVAEQCQMKKRKKDEGRSQTEEEREDDGNASEGNEEKVEDREEFTLEGWNRLKTRTMDMKNVALSCPTFLKPEDRVIEKLDAIYEYIDKRDNPENSDFEFVDQSMRHVNDLVCSAIDKYLGETRSESNGVYNRTYKILKAVTAVTVLVAFVGIFAEFLPTFK